MPRTASDSAAPARSTSPPSPCARDEIGLLARALADMTQSLRQRIDATDAFAADVTHELKNPLASLRSAVDTLERIEDDPVMRTKLLDVVRQDVRRLDRLVVEIAEASRLDAELSRARFEPIDLGKMIETLLPMWEGRPRAGRDRLRPTAGRHRDRSWATNRGSPACSTISSTMPSPSRRPAAWSRSARPWSAARW